jgi:chaperonin GroEL (HSP60 family)
VRVISQAVEGTIGPKGLDIMMVDSYGNVVITNDGVTILSLMEVNHPATRMIIDAAKVQHEEVGDGTTTATIMASAIIAEGLNQVLKGVRLPRFWKGSAWSYLMDWKRLRGACARFQDGRIRCFMQPR